MGSILYIVQEFTYLWESSIVDLEKATRRVKEFRQREEDILQCALKLFLSLGEDKVTVEMIADEVGIGKGTIYKHFTTKFEIYLLLMIRYEEELADLLHSIQVDDDKDKLVREYFRFRMTDPDRYALFDRLEAKCISENALPELTEKLHRIRASNSDLLEQVVKARIDEDILLDVPPHYHICAAWAMVHGAVGLYHSNFFKDRIEDKKGVFDFLMEVAVRMGNKSRYKKELSEQPELDSQS